MYMKITGIEGPCKVKGFEGYIDIHTCSWDASVPTSAGVSGGAKHGRSQLGMVTVSKDMDGTSPLLAIKCATGKPFDECEIQITGAGEGGDKKWYWFKLKEAVVANISQNMMAESAGQESVSFDYTSVKFGHVGYKHGTDDVDKEDEKGYDKLGHVEL